MDVWPAFPLTVISSETLEESGENGKTIAAPVGDDRRTALNAGLRAVLTYQEGFLQTVSAWREPSHSAT
jgi:hypothetical protein